MHADEFLTTRQVADLVGVKEPATVRRWVKVGLWKRGQWVRLRNEGVGTFRIRRSALEEFRRACDPQAEVVLPARQGRAERAQAQLDVEELRRMLG